MPESKPQDVERGLEDIRREVIESRNLVIKTDNLLKNLHAELKLLGKRQEDFQKRQWISSAAAYAGFAVLCAIGAFALSSARTSSAASDKERMERQVAELTEQLERHRNDAAVEKTASKGAAEAYRMMTQLSGDERLKGIDAYRKLDSSRLTALEKSALSDRADLLRNEVGQAALERGKVAFRKQDYAAAVEELGRFLAMGPAKEESLDASFFLGASLLQVRKPEDAAGHLARFVAEDKKSKTRDYAMLLLAQAYDQAQQFDKAAETAREALATYPDSEFVPQLKGRLSSAKRGLAGAETPVPPPPGGPVVPAGGQPAPQKPVGAVGPGQ